MKGAEDQYHDFLIRCDIFSILLVAGILLTGV